MQMVILLIFFLNESQIVYNHLTLKQDVRILLNKHIWIGRNSAKFGLSRQ